VAVSERPVAVRRRGPVALGLVTCLLAASVTVLAFGVRRAMATPQAIRTAAGGLGAGLESFVGQRPTALAATGSKLYVADSALNVVRAINVDALDEQVVAGNGARGSSGDGGPATAASLALSPTVGGGLPNGLAADGSGSLFIADTYDNAVRKVDAAGTITTVATGLSTPTALVADPQGDVYVADTGNNRVVKVDPSGAMTTVLSATGFQPEGLSIDPAGNVYVADAGNCVIDKVAGTSATVYAGMSGTCSYGGDDGPATAAALRRPAGVTFDANTGNVYIADTGNCLIRQVSSGGTITTVAGTKPSSGSTPVCTLPDESNLGGDLAKSSLQVTLRLPVATVVDAKGYLDIADTGNHRVRALSLGSVKTRAGQQPPGASGNGGQATDAELSAPVGIVAAGGNLYFADPAANMVRQIDSGGVITALAGTGVAGFSPDGSVAAQAKLNGPTAVAVDLRDDVFIADTGNCVVREVTASDHKINTVAGTGTCGSLGTTGNPKSIQLRLPAGVAVNANATMLYIADTGNNLVREVVIASTSANMQTIAGGGSSGTGTCVAGDPPAGTPALTAKLQAPRGLALDSSGNLFIADTGSNCIRKYSGGTVTTVAGTDSPGYAGDGGKPLAALLRGPQGVAVDSTGVVFIADTGNNVVRKVAGSMITTVAGTGSAGYTGDGDSATTARLYLPRGVVAGANGNFLVADSGNHRIRAVGPATAPDPPANANAKPCEAAAVVSWTPPASGGSTILTYTVTALPGGSTASVGGAGVTETVVSGLTDGTAYTFTVTATNALGTSQPSSPTAAVTPAPDTALNCAGLTAKDPVRRLAGTDRIATGIAVSKAGFPTDKSAGAVVLATAATFPDALAGGPLAVARKAPLLLTGGSALDSRVKTEIQRVLSPGKTVYLLGGPQALADNVDADLKAAGYQTQRFQGPDRYATAVAVADAGLGNPSTILLATGANFPDAISGSSAAAKVSGAVLLTNGQSMPVATANYLAAHPGDKQYALGGPAAKAAPKATPLVGVDRYQTAVKVATAFFTAPLTVGVASGEKFPDALTGGALMGASAGPLVLAQLTTLPPFSGNYLSGQADSIASATVFGGPLALGDAVVAATQDDISPAPA
jgi:sugar lactone lactonase YvrE/putative cell wall-binding protein